MEVELDVGCIRQIIQQLFFTILVKLVRAQLNREIQITHRENCQHQTFTCCIVNFTAISE